MARLLSPPSFSSLEQGQGLQYLIEASRARNITGEEVKAILKLPVLNKPWDAVGVNDLVDTTGRSLIQKDLMLDEVKNAINPPYVFRWLLMMTKEASENHCITDINAAVFEFLSSRCFQAALDTLKKLSCTGENAYLQLFSHMSNLTRVWNGMNEKDERVYIAIIDHLIEERGLKIKEVGLGHTALIFAVQAGLKKIVECFKHGADVNWGPANRAMLLTLANSAAHGSGETAEYLRDRYHLH